MAQPKDFGFGSEEQMVRDSARKLLKDAAGIETLRALVARDHKAAYESAVQPAPWDERLWRQMVELGWTALAVPEEAGGAGMRMVAVAALAEEIGRDVPGVKHGCREAGPFTPRTLAVRIAHIRTHQPGNEDRQQDARHQNQQPQDVPIAHPAHRDHEVRARAGAGPDAHSQLAAAEGTLHHPADGPRTRSGLRVAILTHQPHDHALSYPVELWRSPIDRLAVQADLERIALHRGHESGGAGHLVELEDERLVQVGEVHLAVLRPAERPAQ